MNETLHFIYFPAAVMLGAMHALEPGHAKALTASYLIGIKGTKKDSVLLGLSVALTHSIVVILISVVGLWIGNEAFTGQATAILEKGSGFVAISIGLWMLWRRLSRRYKQHQEEHHHHDHAHEEHHHHHLDDVAHAKEHAETLPDYVKKGERPTTGQIILFGAAGGMIPCPASITVMLLALSVGKMGMGLFTVMGFSLGLAVTLVGVGLVVVTGLSKIEGSGKFSWLTRQAPIISACLVIVSGLFAVFIARH